MTFLCSHHVNTFILTSITFLILTYFSLLQSLRNRFLFFFSDFFLLRIVTSLLFGQRSTLLFGKRLMQRFFFLTVIVYYRHFGSFWVNTSTEGSLCSPSTYLICLVQSLGKWSLKFLREKIITMLLILRMWVSVFQINMNMPFF